MRYTGINIMLWSDIRKKRNSNSAGIEFRDFVVLKLYAGTKFRENGQNRENREI